MDFSKFRTVLSAGREPGAASSASNDPSQPATATGEPPIAPSSHTGPMDAEAGDGAPVELEPAVLHVDDSVERPHPDLATIDEAHEVGMSLLPSMPPGTHVWIRQARPGQGLAPAQGNHLPLLIAWSEPSPETGMPVLFVCSVGELARAMAATPGGVWVKDFEARTMRRERR